MGATNTARFAGWTLLMVAFVAVGIATAAIGLWRWQPLPSDPKTSSSGSQAPIEVSSADARSYLRARPFDPVAYVGMAYDLAGSGRAGTPPAGEKALAEQALAVAAQLAPVDPIVIRARIADAYARKNVKLAMTLSADLAVLSAVDRADAFALLTSLMRTQEWPQFLTSKLSMGWAAADAFVRHVCYSDAKIDILLPLAVAVGQKQPLVATTLNCVAGKAIANNQTATAHWLWLNASTGLPKKIPFVLNGDFESALSGGPFDWALSVGGDFREGFTVGVVRDNTTTGSRNAYLTARFNGRAITAPLARQNLALKPGKYSLSYRLQVSGLASDKLAWAIRCGSVALAFSNVRVMETPSDRNWTTYSAEFAVPTGCSGQVLMLEVVSRLDTLQGLLGTAKYDEVIIGRI